MKNYILVNGKKMICKIYDNGGQSLDCYTVVFRAYRERYGSLVRPYLAMSLMPFHPQGFCQHGELVQRDGSYLGKRISFFDLNEDCQKAILNELQ